MRCILAVLAIVLLVAACGPKAPAGENKTVETTGNTTEPSAPQDAVPAETNKTGTVVTKAPSAAPTGAMVAVVKVRNADALPAITSMNVTFRKVEIQSSNKSQWVTVSALASRPNLMALGDDAYEIGLNTVPAQFYKAIRVQLKTAGDVFMDDALGQYNIPNEYVQVLKEFEVKQDETLTFVLDIDIGSSTTVVENNVVLKPDAKVSLLSGAGSARQGDGLVKVTGGDVLFSYEKRYEQLLPPGTLEKAVADCKDACPDTCSGKADSCTDECKTAVASGCQIGDRDCRDKCDPFLSPVLCRDNCEESSSTCQGNLLPECGISCQKKHAAPCIASCEAACAS